MAKRPNIIRFIVNEIEKGNQYIDNKGNFISKSETEKRAMEAYLKDMKAGKIDMSVPPTEYVHSFTDTLTNADTLLKEIHNMGILGNKTEIETDPIPTEPSKEVTADVESKSGSGKAKPKSKNSTKTDTK